MEFSDLVLHKIFRVLTESIGSFLRPPMDKSQAEKTYLSTFLFLKLLKTRYNAYKEVVWCDIRKKYHTIHADNLETV